MGHETIPGSVAQESTIEPHVLTVKDFERHWEGGAHLVFSALVRMVEQDPTHPLKIVEAGSKRPEAVLEGDINQALGWFDERGKTPSSVIILERIRDNAMPLSNRARSS